MNSDVGDVKSDRPRVDDLAATDAGGPSPFPETSWRIVLDTRDESSPAYKERINRLAQIYWRPIYWYIRLEWKQSHEKCKDLTQQFFILLLERKIFQMADPGRGSFRVFLKTVLKHFLMAVKRSENRLRRGGGTQIIPLAMSPTAEERILPVAKDLSPEQVFDQEWSHSLMEEAYRRLEARACEGGHRIAWQAFKEYYLNQNPEQAPSYRELAQRFQVTEFQIQNDLYRMRQDLKRIVRDLVADSARSPQEAEEELRELLLHDLTL